MRTRPNQTVVALVQRDYIIWLFRFWANNNLGSLEKHLIVLFLSHRRALLFIVKQQDWIPLWGHHRLLNATFRSYVRAFELVSLSLCGRSLRKLIVLEEGNWTLVDIRIAFDRVHFDLDPEYGTRARAIWLYSDRAVVCVDDLLHNVETESDSFLIDARCPEQFAKSCEKFRFLLIRYTDSSVLHHYCQLVDWPAIVNHLKRDETCSRELESITDQVYHDLLYPSFIAN